MVQLSFDKILKFLKQLLLKSMVLFIAVQRVSAAENFYVDPVKGSDYNNGTIDTPFRTLQKTLQIVSIRVNDGERSDKIFLRGGVYKQNSTETQYQLNLKGTPDDYALLSAMPCESNTPGAVQGKSGQWYEKVVFDDAWDIKTQWTRVVDRPNVWQTQPDFVHNEWPYTKMRWAWAGTEGPENPKDIYFFTLAPYMLLQDGKPLKWVHTLSELREPGVRSYDFESKTLYLWPLDNKDPNTCSLESWYGGPDKNGYLLRDGEGRGLFDGNLEYAAIRGFEFRMFTRIFEFHRRGYVSEDERIIQRYFRFEDNACRYCYIHLLLDGNTVLTDERNDGLIPPKFEDRSNWIVRNNIFYRPTKECFQVHGVDHIFENNEIIEHGGPWGGPASRVSAVNARNMKNVKIRYNFIQGQGESPYNIGSVFMIEASDKNHADEKGDYLFGDVLYEYNIFANITRGTAIVAGKGGCRMRNITIRNNIFKTNKAGPAIRISSPHINLKIENNVFYDQSNPIVLVDNNKKMFFNSLPSTMMIRKNIFMNNQRTIDQGLLAAHKDSQISIEQNLYFNNQQNGLGQNQIDGDPRFRDPSNFDFRLKENSSAKVDGEYLGAYDMNDKIPNRVDWWRYASVYGRKK